MGKPDREGGGRKATDRPGAFLRASLARLGKFYSKTGLGVASYDASKTFISMQSLASTPTGG